MTCANPLPNLTLYFFITCAGSAGRLQVLVDTHGGSACFALASAGRLLCTSLLCRLPSVAAGDAGRPHVLVKTHGWSNRLALGRAQHVLLTHRDLRAVVASYRRMGWAADLKPGYVAEHLRWQVYTHIFFPPFFFFLTATCLCLTALVGHFNAWAHTISRFADRLCYAYWLACMRNGRTHALPPMVGGLVCFHGQNVYCGRKGLSGRALWCKA